MVACFHGNVTSYCPCAMLNLDDLHCLCVYCLCAGDSVSICSLPLRTMLSSEELRFGSNPLTTVWDKLSRECSHSNTVCIIQLTAS